ncbi:hypothetical protein [Methanoculleus chikugoensis]|uniref:hypothetical protein n=1 Tax=Methanoculleus chikugoensis TaxID=118126 RepID=UPI000AEF4A70|nr:hypothetical protein [Methanoculleus chikugoensis]
MTSVVPPRGPFSRVTVDCGFALSSILSWKAVDNLGIRGGAGLWSRLRRSRFTSSGASEGRHQPFGPPRTSSLSAGAPGSPRSALDRLSQGEDGVVLFLLTDMPGYGIAGLHPALDISTPLRNSPNMSRLCNLPILAVQGGASSCHVRGTLH